MGIRSLKVRGPFRGPSGYEHHVRAFVRELDRRGVAIELVDLPEWASRRLPSELVDPWFDTLGRAVGARTVLHFCMPHQLAVERERVNVNYTMFEATRIPPDWAARGRDLALTVVPTESSRRAWLTGGVPASKVRLCPLGVDPQLFGRRPAPMDLRLADDEPVAQYRVRFLNVSELSPRKNLIGLLRAWIRATDRADDAVLIMKIGAYAPGSREAFRRRLSLLQDELRRTLAEAAPVLFLSELFSDQQMPTLFAAATHYISTSFGEGWDQPMVEAAAIGLTLIAPAHSGYLDYLDPSCAHLVSTREVPARFDWDPQLGALFEGADWWEPDEDEMVARIRSAIDRADRLPASARDRILSRFTWERATRQLLEILDEVAE